MKKGLFILLIILLCWQLGVAAVSVKATVDRNKITIGDRIVYRVTVESDTGDEVVFPDIAGNLGEFEIKDYKITGPKKKLIFKGLSLKSRNVTEYRYEITTFTTGEYKIPSLGLGYKAKDGGKKEINSGEIKVFIEGVKPSERDKGGIRDIKPPVSIPAGPLAYVLLFMFLLAVAGGLGGTYYYQGRKKKGIFSGGDINRPADLVAYERLEKLKSLGLIDQGKIKEYYIILSEIIRQYIHRRYSIPVLERTTGELYRELRMREEIEKKHCTVTKEFLEGCDLVKFAKFVPDAEVIGRDTASAKNIVDITRPVVQLPAEEKKEPA